MAEKKVPKKVARKAKYKITDGQTDAEVKTNVKKARRAYAPRMMGVQRTELVEFLMDNESRPTREVVKEFREACPHNFTEIAHIVRGYKRHTYQTCRRCGQFATMGRAVV